MADTRNVEERRFAAIQALRTVVECLKESNPQAVFTEGKQSLLDPTKVQGSLTAGRTRPPTCSCAPWNWRIASPSTPWTCSQGSRLVARVREHHRATLAFLGWDIPEVHLVMDAAVAYLGARHRAVGHNLRALRAIADLFGRRGRIIATVHIFQDAGILTVGGTRRTSTVAPIRRQRSRRGPKAVTARAGRQGR